MTRFSPSPLPESERRKKWLYLELTNRRRKQKRFYAVLKWIAELKAEAGHRSMLRLPPSFRVRGIDPALPNWEVCMPLRM